MTTATNKHKHEKNNFLQTALTAIIVFLGLNLIMNTFFPQPNNQTPPNQISFKTTKNEFPLREPVTINLHNNTTSTISLKSNCPYPEVQVFKLQNGEWTELIAKPTTTPCPESLEISIEPTKSYIFSLANWNNSLFNELGYYKVKLNLENKTIESNQFEIKPQGAISWFWTTLFYQPIYNTLVTMISISPNQDLGLAIILLTLIIRTILLIPSQKALKSQKILQNLQPKIDHLKQTHADNQQLLGLEMMKLYKDHKVNPFSSCLPLLIQFPILIALFYVIQNGLNPEEAYLLYNFVPKFDYANVNTNFLGILELTKINFIILPILIASLQFLQMKLALPKNKPKIKKSSVSNEMELANKTMIFIMPILIGIFTASVPAGVGLYWGFSTIYGIIQQLFVNKSIPNTETQITEIKSNKQKKTKHKYHNSTSHKTDSNGNNSEKITKIKI